MRRAAPQLSLLLMCVDDLALLFKGVPPSPRRPVEALALVLMVVVIYCVIYGSIADVLYLLSFPTIAMSASFDAWWAILILPFTFGAIVLYILTRCCGRVVKKAADYVAEPSVGVSGIPPLVDLVQNRSSAAWLGRAIFLFPIVMVTSFTFGLSWLVTPQLSPDVPPSSYSLAALCPSPLTERASGLSATGLYWASILLTANSQHSWARAAVRAISGVAVPQTTSIQELYEHSTRASASISSETILNSLWSLAFEPYTDGCTSDGHILTGVSRDATASGCGGLTVGTECLSLPEMRVQMMRPVGNPYHQPVQRELCFGCQGAVTASIASWPSSCPPGYQPQLLGNVTLRQSGRRRTGLFVFNDLLLTSGSENVPICAGRHLLAFTLPHAGGIASIAYADLYVVDHAPANTTITTSNVTTWPGFVNPVQTLNNIFDPIQSVLATTQTVVQATASLVTTTTITNITSIASGALGAAQDVASQITTTTETRRHSCFA